MPPLAVDPDIEHATAKPTARRHQAPLAFPPLQRGADDGLDRSSLPLLSASALRPCPALYRDGDHGRADQWRCCTLSAPRRGRASAGAATGRQRTGGPGYLRENGRGSWLRRGEPQRRLPQRPRAEQPDRRLPDGASRAGGRLRESDARRRGHRRDGQASHRHQWPRQLCRALRFRRPGAGSRLPQLHRACAHCHPRRAVAETEPRSATAAL